MMLTDSENEIQTAGPVGSLGIGLGPLSSARLDILPNEVYFETFFSSIREPIP